MAISWIPFRHYPERSEGSIYILLSHYIIMTLHIRQTTLEDITHIRQLDTHFDAHAEEHTKHIHTWTHRTAREDEQLVGDIIFDYGLYGNCFIRLVHVHPDHRRKGIATQLIQFAETSCTKNKIFISTQISNTNMNALLQKNWYLSCGHIKYINEEADDDELFFYKQL